MTHPPLSLVIAVLQETCTGGKLVADVLCPVFLLLAGGSGMWWVLRVCYFLPSSDL